MGNPLSAPKEDVAENIPICIGPKQLLSGRIKGLPESPKVGDLKSEVETHMSLSKKSLSKCFSHSVLSTTTC